MHVFNRNNTFSLSPKWEGSPQGSKKFRCRAPAHPHRRADTNEQRGNDFRLANRDVVLDTNLQNTGVGAPDSDPLPGACAPYQIEFVD